ncbi:MAG: D-isomer specific 2-hydroxyacid dehydrogenase family [Frankiales bacterium]|nr:D-isomer specific 2-hydroxyacid dehydrogenase family [Frankiales bacterium]
MRVLLTCPQMQANFAEHADRLAAAGLECDLPPVVQALSESELLEIIDRYDGMVAGDDEITAAVLEKGAANRLKVISKWGVGVDGIDLVAARRLGVTVTNCPGAFDAEVADVCVGYLVLLARGLHVVDAKIREGSWHKVLGTSLNGATIGIVGLGGIGRALAKRVLAMDMTVLGYDPFPASQQAAAALGVQLVELDELLRSVDYLSLNCPLTADNRHLLNRDSLATVKPGVRIVNTGRGPLIDEAALVEALHDGRVAGAALDVFEVEPLPMGSPLRTLSQVVLGSHNSSNTAEAGARTSRTAVDNLLRELGLS